MSVTRVGLGALVAAASLYAVSGQAAAASSAHQESGRTSAMRKSSTSQGKERAASGQVKAIDAKALTLNNGEQFRLTHQTQFLRDGHKVGRQDVKEGERVRASYAPRGKMAYADRIEILSGKSAKK